MPKSPEMGSMPEQPKVRERSTINVGEARAQLKKRKSEYPGYVRVEITFDDIYQSELADKFHWDDNQIGSFDDQLFAKLKDRGAVINWEDKEFFTVDIPESSTQDIISDVESALQSTFRNPLIAEQLETFKQAQEAAEGRAGELARQELAKVREEETLFQAYKEKPDAKSPADHEGYCAIKLVKIKKASGIGYSDEEFLGRENRKIVTKPDMVILSISVQGKPFDQLYRGRIIKHEEFYGGYESELQKLVQGIQTSPEDVIKVSYQISTIRNKGEADGERIKLLCTMKFAEKVAEAVKNLYPDLHDISKERD